jgi:hypothetical protein
MVLVWIELKVVKPKSEARPFILLTQSENPTVHKKPGQVRATAAKSPFLRQVGPKNRDAYYADGFN